MANPKRKIRPVSIDKRATREQKAHKVRRRTDVEGRPARAAADKAKAAGHAKADEVRTTLEGKVEQGKCSLGSLLADEREA